MAAVVGVGLLASLSIFESIGFPAAEPIDTTVWLAATAGDTLTVTDVTGQELSGSVLGITPDSLSVGTSAGVVDVSRRDVRLVRHRFADPLGDGTTKGLWVGLGSAFFMYFLAQNDLGISDLTSANSLRFMAGILTLGRRGDRPRHRQQGPGGTGHLPRAVPLQDDPHAAVVEGRDRCRRDRHAVTQAGAYRYGVTAFCISCGNRPTSCGWMDVGSTRLDVGMSVPT